MRMPGMFTLEKTCVQETQNEERDGKRGEGEETFLRVNCEAIRI